MLWQLRFGQLCCDAVSVVWGTGIAWCVVVVTAKLARGPSRSWSRVRTRAFVSARSSCPSTMMLQSSRLLRASYDYARRRGLGIPKRSMAPGLSNTALSPSRQAGSGVRNMRSMGTRFENARCIV